MRRDIKAKTKEQIRTVVVPTLSARDGSRAEALLRLGISELLFDVYLINLFVYNEWLAAKAFRVRSFKFDSMRHPIDPAWGFTKGIQIHSYRDGPLPC